MKRAFLTVLVAALALASCSPAKDRDAPVVLAASSLQDVLDAAADAYAAQGRPRPVLSFAATSALARQVEAGAPADLFVSADERWMDDLNEKRLIRAETRTDLAANRLVLAATVMPGPPTVLTDAASVGRALAGEQVAMADPEAVPAGRYARQAFESLGLWQGIAPRVVRAENVRAALALAARGEVLFAVVYRTDALAEPDVRIAYSFPAESHVPIAYPAAVLAGAKGDEAERFRRFLLSPDGQAIFARFGFDPANGR